MQCLGESHANELQQCIQALKAQIVECNKSKYGKISTYGQRGENMLQKSKHALSTQDLINQRVVVARNYGKTRVDYNNKVLVVVRNQTSMKMTMNLKRTGWSKLKNLTVRLTKVILMGHEIMKLL